MSLTKQYFKYVSQNIFGLLGTSWPIPISSRRRQAPAVWLC